jgi:hypothetical protein
MSTMNLKLFPQKPSYLKLIHNTFTSITLSRFWLVHTVLCNASFDFTPTLMLPACWSSCLSVLTATDDLKIILV